MTSVERVDRNFRIDSKIEREGITFFDVKEKPFSVYGVFRENGAYVRMPEEIARRVNSGVHLLSKNTAGGRVRFITDSPYIAFCLYVKTEFICVNSCICP